MCGCRYTTITKVMTLGSHKKGGHSWGPSLLGVSPPGDTAVVILWENSWNIYGKLWKMMEKTYGKKKTRIMGKPMENPEFDGWSSFGPVFMALFWGGIHQFQRHTHNHPYVIVRNPIPLIKLNITWSNYETAHPKRWYRRGFTMIYWHFGLFWTT